MDVHGCYDELMIVLRHINFNFDHDRLFCVGDVVDRGTNNVRTIALYYQPWFFSVLGNHELMIYDLQAISHRNGNQWVIDMLNSGSNNQQIIKDLQEHIQSMPSAIDISVGDKKYGVIHAEMPFGTDYWDDISTAPDYRSTMSEQSFIWGRLVRSARIEVEVIGIDYLFTGHTIVKQPTKMGQQIFLDTGFYHTGKISIFDTQTENIHTISVDFSLHNVVSHDIISVNDLADSSVPL